MAHPLLNSLIAVFFASILFVVYSILSSREEVGNREKPAEKQRH